MNFFKCRICGNSEDNIEYILEEMMFGLRDKFEYIKCAECGCLQIKEIPLDLDKYYPNNYYSYNPKKNYLRNFFSLKRDQYSINHKSLVGKLLIKKFGHSNLYSWFKEIDVSYDDKILDIGCGSGQFLKKLAILEFNNLTGIDPFIAEDSIYKDRVKFLKRNLENFNDAEFDFIMLHHSLEHMEDQVETLIKINQLLRKNASLLIRVPVIDSAAWDEYNVNWIQLDPPRHFYLHSLKSMNYLAKIAGFNIYKILFDSTSFQFWGSEQNKSNIPLSSENSYSVNPDNSVFNSSVIKQYEKKQKCLMNQERETRLPST
jgi:2-polyprenyl-3-methyl-5-hydroxy-6-metoxy-1,4-benzoquinol methylase